MSLVAEAALLVYNAQWRIQWWGTDEDRCRCYGHSWDAISTFVQRVPLLWGWEYLRLQEGKRPLAGQSQQDSFMFGDVFGQHITPLQWAFGLEKNKKTKKCVSVDLIALGGFLPVQQRTEMGPLKSQTSRLSPLCPPSLAFHSNWDTRPVSAVFALPSGDLQRVKET